MEGCIIGSVQLEFSLRLLNVYWLFLEKKVRLQFPDREYAAFTGADML